MVGLAASNVGVLQRFRIVLSQQDGDYVEHVPGSGDVSIATAAAGDAVYDDGL